MDSLQIGSRDALKRKREWKQDSLMSRIVFQMKGDYTIELDHIKH